MNDPFLHTSNSVDRLLAEYRQHGKLIIAVDFDDTLYDYHGAGRTYERVLDLLRCCQALDFWLVLFTACAPSKREFQKNHLKDLGINIHSVNENPIVLPFGNHGKIYYNILLDDRAGLGQAVEILIEVIRRIEAGY